MRKNDTENDRLEGVLIYFHSEEEPGNNRVIRSDWGTMQQSPDGSSMLLTLYDGYEYQDTQYKRLPKKADNEFEFLRSEFEKIVLRIDLSNFNFNKTDEELFSQYYEMLNIKQLTAMEDSLTIKYGERQQDYRNYTNKFISIRKPAVVESKKDTVLLPKKGVRSTSKAHAKDPIPGESFYAFLQDENPIKIVQAAKNLTRNSRNFIKRSDEEFKTRMTYINRYKIERHRKWMLSVACLVLFFVGAPLGAIIRKGGFGFPVVFSIIFFLIFHISNTSGEKMAKTGVAIPAVGMWLGIMVLIPFAIFLTYKAINDSSILEKDFYKQIFKPLKKLFKKRKRDNEGTTALP